METYNEFHVLYYRAPRKGGNFIQVSLSSNNLQNKEENIVRESNNSDICYYNNYFGNFDGDHYLSIIFVSVLSPI